MSKNIKEIGKELLGKSLNSFHKKTGLSQLERNNKMQDGILDGILSQVDNAYIEKTEQSNVIHLDGSGDGVVVLDSIEGNTLTDAISSTTSYSLKNTTKSINSRWSTIGISCRQGKLNDKIYYRIKLKINNLTTDSSQLSIMSMRDSGGYNHNVALFKDLEIGNINEISTIRAIDSNCNNLYNSVTIGNHGEVPSDCTDGVEFANFTLIDFIVVNLTELFGSGNEPTKEWCDSNIPYFEGLQSSFEEKVNDDSKYEVEIVSMNENLLDKKSFDRLVLNGGTINYQYKGLVKGSIFEQYSNLKFTRNKGQNVQCLFYYYDINNKPLVSNYYYGTMTYNIPTPPSDAYTFLIIIRPNGNNSIYNNELDDYFNKDYDIRIYKGDTTIPYVPHKQNKIKVLLNSPLLKGDKLVIKDGKLCHYHKSNLIQVSIENNFTISNTSSSNGVYIQIPNNKLEKPFIYDPNNIICNKFKTVDNSGLHSFNYAPCIGVTTDNYIRFIIKYETMNMENYDFNKISQWLMENPIMFMYKLAEPYYEEITNEYGEPIILEGYENGTLYIDSTIIPTTTVRYTPKMESFKTLKEVNKNNNSITLDINENIIPYMMDVDYMIMEKELCLLNTKNIRKMEVLDMTSMQKRTQDMLERLIKGKTLTEQECKTRVTTYLNAGKITDEQAEELMLVISEIYN